MAVIDDIRRMMQLDIVFAGLQLGNTTTWYKGRLRQANDNTIIFRSSSQDGTIEGIQLGSVQETWESTEKVGVGIQIFVPVQGLVGTTWFLRQSLPEEMT
jgi:hypothetical protein